MTNSLLVERLFLTVLMLAAVFAMSRTAGTAPAVAQSVCSTAVAGGGWVNRAFTSQTGSFTVQFDATPSVSPIDSVIGLSQDEQTVDAGFAALVRFNTSGNIDARNGGAYAATSTIPYSGAVIHHFRMEVNVSSRSYSIFVTPKGGLERTVGSNFLFQSGVTRLDWFGVNVNSSIAGLTTVCNFAIMKRPDPDPSQTFLVSSIAELQSRINIAVAGDQIILRNGVYTSTGSINITRSGTAARPILIAAETVGDVEIKGSASFNLNSPASYVVVRGFKLTHAIGRVNIRAGATHCRLTRNVFQLTGTGSYLEVDGDDAEIDHNAFQNKTTLGQMVTIRGPGTAGMAQRTWVHHNLFQDFSPQTANGAETLQIGLSQKSLTDAHTLVENNLFIRTDGENECISNKSSSNTYRFNTFRNTVGELTLRHGNRCVVHSNFFINSHGLRFFGDDHQIFSNYFEACNPAMQIGNGAVQIPPGPLDGFDQPNRVTVSFNTFIDNRQSVQMGGRTGGIGATDLVFSNNIILSDSGTVLRINGPLPNATFQGNIVFGAAPNGNMPPDGARRIDPMLRVQDNSGVFRLQSLSPAIDSSLGSFSEVTIDLDGEPRLGAKDVGADEFSTAPATRRPLTLGDVGPNAP